MISEAQKKTGSQKRLRTGSLIAADSSQSGIQIIFLSAVYIDPHAIYDERLCQFIFRQTSRRPSIFIVVHITQQLRCLCPSHVRNAGDIIVFIAGNFNVDSSFRIHIQRIEGAVGTKIQKDID